MIYLFFIFSLSTISAYAGGYEDAIERMRQDCISKKGVFTENPGGGAGCVSGPAQERKDSPESPHKNPLPEKENPQCRSYAQDAIADFQKMNENAKCRIKADARWQNNFDNHYKWCLTAQKSWLQSEAKARRDHLINCGELHYM
jgi:hypothetical protein